MEYNSTKESLMFLFPSKIYVLFCIWGNQLQELNWKKKKKSCLFPCLEAIAVLILTCSACLWNLLLISCFGVLTHLVSWHLFLVFNGDLLYAVCQSRVLTLCLILYPTTFSQCLSKTSLLLCQGLICYLIPLVVANKENPRASSWELTCSWTYYTYKTSNL